MTDYERIGGEPALERLIARFLDRVFGDFIIGFLFEGRDRARIHRHEVEHAAALLGGPKRYAGRPLAAVHQPLRINRGQFRRRLAILRVVLHEDGVPPEIVERWIGHDARLERAITDGLDCIPEAT